MALFNNGFPASYPYYQPIQQPIQQPVQPQQNGMIWVQGEAGAKSYLVAPNTTAQLWDSEAQVIYIKSADASGMPSIKVLDYTIRDAQKPIFSNEPNYVTVEEINGLKRRIEALERGRNESAIQHDAVAE